MQGIPQSGGGCGGARGRHGGLPPEERLLCDYRVVLSFRRGYACARRGVGGETVISPNLCYKLCSNSVFYLQSEKYAALCGQKSYKVYTQGQIFPGFIGSE